MIDGPNPSFTSIEEVASTRAENYFLDLIRSRKATVIASRPVLEAKGLEGIVQIGMTLPELHYSAQAVDEYLLDTFERKHFEPLHQLVQMYAWRKDPQHLATALREIQIMQKMIPRLASKGEDYKLVCTDGKKATWPTVAAQKTADILSEVGNATHTVLDEILRDIETASPSVRDNKLKRAGKYLITAYGDSKSLCSAIQKVQLPIAQYHKEKFNTFSQVMVIQPPKEGDSDPIEGLFKEEGSYLRELPGALWRGLKLGVGAGLIWHGSVAAMHGMKYLSVSDKQDFLMKVTPSLDQVQKMGELGLKTLAFFGVASVAINQLAEAYIRSINRKTTAQYAQALGTNFYDFLNVGPSDPVTTAQQLKEEVLFRVEYILNSRSGQFVGVGELQRRVFPNQKQSDLSYSDSSYSYRLLDHAISLLSMREDMIVERRNNFSEAHFEYRIMKKEKVAA